MQEDALFGDPEPRQPVQAAATAEALPEWQVVNLRQALDALGLVAMDERQKVVEELAGRPVASLRDLTFSEARVVSEGLSARRKDTTSTGSAWDNRDEDTWIDRL